MGIVEKAKEAVNTAVSRSGEISGQAVAAAERASTAVRDQTVELSSDVRERLTSMSFDVADSTVARVTAVLAEFNAALPILKLAGYSVGDISVDLGLPPKMTANFSTEETVADEVIEEMLGQHENAALASMLVRALMRARKVQDSVTVGGLRPKGLALNIGLVPSVTIRFGFSSGGQ